MHVLNPIARWIWETLSSGVSLKDIEIIFLNQTGHNQQQIEEILAAWRSVGLDPSYSVAPVAALPYCHTYWLGGCRIRVESDQKNILEDFHACVRHIEDFHVGPIATNFSLTQKDDGYVICKNQKKIHCLSSVNDLIVQAAWEMIEVGCNIPDRLLTVHGGAVANKNSCCIIAGTGGSGKTTLVAGLAASGFTFIADDVIPIESRSGLLVPIPISMCIKEGSWSVLKDCYPTATTLPIYRRFGKSVRFYPPPLPAVPLPTRRYQANAILFPCYSPGSTPQITPIATYDILTELMRSNSIIDSWVPERIDALTAWVSGIKGYRIIYPDLQHGMRLVGKIIKDML